jgi:hypothetical protein
MEAGLRTGILVALALTAGCDFFSVDTELDDACIELNNKVIDGATNGELKKVYTYDDLSVADGFISLGADITHFEVTLQAVDGVSDLSFLDSVRVTLSNADLPSLEVIRCDDGACASATRIASVSQAAPPNLADYALTGQVTVGVGLYGPDLPTTSWTANVKICLSGSAHVAAGI